MTEQIELTFREKKTLGVLAKLSEGLSENELPAIRQLARKAFPGKRPFAVADRIVRNSLRRLLKHGFVTRIGKGAYKVVAP